MQFLIVLVLLALWPNEHSAEFTSDQPPYCCFKVDNKTRQIIDGTGRYRLFHGVNVVYKNAPYYPQLNSFDPQLSLSSEDIDFLVDNGFNVVRLYVAWQGFEPTKDNYNNTYIDVIASIVNKLGEAGVSTILDCHQDLFSPKFCGEGVPDYAAIYSNRSLPFPGPIPQLSAFKVDNKTGYPLSEECQKHSFFTYYFSDAEGKAWQSFYENEQGVQDRFGLFWQKVAEKFSGIGYVLGYELINEPWAGDLYRHPDQLEAHVADKRNLQPLYEKLHNSIRQVDQDHIIFFEPTIIVTSVPLKNIASTGLTQGPGGVQFNDRQVFSYHIYCVAIDKNGQPSSKFLCNLSDKEIMNMRLSDQEKLGVAGFLTEWGAYTETEPGSISSSEALELMELADSNFQSWTYWQYKGYADFTTQSNTDEGLWRSDGTINQNKLKLLSRTYVQALAGQLINQTFNPTSAEFELSFKANTAIKSPSEVYLNEKLYYTNGYSVSVEPTGSASIQTNTNKVYISFTDATQDSQILTVHIKRK